MATAVAAFYVAKYDYRQVSVYALSSIYMYMNMKRSLLARARPHTSKRKYRALSVFKRPIMNVIWLSGENEREKRKREKSSFCDI